MKLNFVKIEESGRYVAAFKPNEAGALMVNQAKGGDLFIYAYVDGVPPILVDKDVTRRTDYIKMLDFTDVCIRLESTTPIKNAGYSGDATAINIPTGKGEFGLLRVIGEGLGDDSFYEVLYDSFNIGDKITGEITKADDGAYLNINFPLLTREQSYKFSKVALYNMGELQFEITPADEEWEQLFISPNIADEDIVLDLGKYDFVFNLLMFAGVAVADGASAVITYDGKDYTYTKGDNVDVKGLEHIFGGY